MTNLAKPTENHDNLNSDAILSDLQSKARGLLDALDQSRQDFTWDCEYEGKHAFLKLKGLLCTCLSPAVGRIHFECDASVIGVDINDLRQAVEISLPDGNNATIAFRDPQMFVGFKTALGTVRESFCPSTVLHSMAFTHDTRLKWFNGRFQQAKTSETAAFKVCFASVMRINLFHSSIFQKIGYNQQFQYRMVTKCISCSTALEQLLVVAAPLVLPPSSCQSILLECRNVVEAEDQGNRREHGLKPYDIQMQVEWLLWTFVKLHLIRTTTSGLANQSASILQHRATAWGVISSCADACCNELCHELVAVHSDRVTRSVHQVLQDSHIHMFNFTQQPLIDVWIAAFHIMRVESVVSDCSASRKKLSASMHGQSALAHIDATRKILWNICLHCLQTILPAQDQSTIAIAAIERAIHRLSHASIPCGSTENIQLAFLSRVFETIYKVSLIRPSLIQSVSEHADNATESLLLVMLKANSSSEPMSPITWTSEHVGPGPSLPSLLTSSSSSSCTSLGSSSRSSLLSPSSGFTVCSPF